MHGESAHQKTPLTSIDAGPTLIAAAGLARGSISKSVVPMTTPTPPTMKAAVELAPMARPRRMSLSYWGVRHLPVGQAAFSSADSMPV